MTFWKENTGEILESTVTFWKKCTADILERRYW
jgi:hypothetical protein